MQQRLIGGLFLDQRLGEGLRGFERLAQVIQRSLHRGDRRLPEPAALRILRLLEGFLRLFQRLLGPIANRLQIVLETSGPAL